MQMMFCTGKLFISLKIASWSPCTDTAGTLNIIETSDIQHTANSENCRRCHKLNYTK
jgi:hypothetical protein